ncbi:ParA family protein [Pseudomonas nitroreducens]|uniref:ParA family protein n=1 Tax=Pseudomonas nitroreducens TaxID=46680 RepID=UPI00265B612B|nr:ParA family protein [Pseudomonas nitroreducens]MCP1652711.1 chromosome partitioning protein [Pseudomonas nitroreducens]
MAQVISVQSQKGGPGKSTIARAIAVGYAKADWQVKIADMDTGQATATSWNRRRLAAQLSPELAVEMFGNVAKAMASSEQADMMIFDGAPHATKTALDIAKVSDLVVIPTKPSLDDLEPAALFADYLVKNGIDRKRIAYALSQFGKNPREAEDAREYLAHTGISVLPGCIPVAVAYVRAHDLGQSIIETPYKAPREAASEVVQGVMDLMRKLTK